MKTKLLVAALSAFLIVFVACSSSTPSEPTSTQPTAKKEPISLAQDTADHIFGNPGITTEGKVETYVGYYSNMGEKRMYEYDTVRTKNGFVVLLDLKIQQYWPDEKELSDQHTYEHYSWHVISAKYNGTFATVESNDLGDCLTIVDKKTPTNKYHFQLDDKKNLKLIALTTADYIERSVDKLEGVAPSDHAKLNNLAQQAKQTYLSIARNTLTDMMSVAKSTNSQPPF